MILVFLNLNQLTVDTVAEAYTASSCYINLSGDMPFEIEVITITNIISVVNIKTFRLGFFKESVRYPIWTCRDPKNI